MRKLFTLKYLLPALMSGSACLSCSGQIIAWNNYSLTSITYGNVTATTNHPNLKTSFLSRGVGINPTSLNGGYVSSSWVDANEEGAITNNRYYEFSIVANSNFKVSLSTLDAKLRRTATGPNSYIWRYSIDGVNFIDIGSYVSFTASTTTGDVQTQISLSGIAALQDVGDGTTIVLRLYAWGASQANGTLGFGTGNVNSIAIGGTVISSISNTLPVKLLNFSAEKNNKTVKLTWTTTEEINSKEYWIERSSEGNSFQKIGKVNARGNSNILINYQFTDADPNKDENFYRLRTVDLDNRTSLSHVIKINFSKAYTIAIFPIPATTCVTITITNRNEPLLLQIMDMHGKLVTTQKIINQISEVDISRIGKGAYVMKLIGSTSTYTNKLIVQ